MLYCSRLLATTLMVFTVPVSRRKAEYACPNRLQDVKYNGTGWLLRHAGVFVAWVFNMLVSCGLAAAAAWPVVNIAPAAAGAGVAEVMAYLNGCSMPKVSLQPQVPTVASCAQPWAISRADSAMLFIGCRSSTLRRWGSSSRRAPARSAPDCRLALKAR